MTAEADILTASNVPSGARAQRTARRWFSEQRLRIWAVLLALAGCVAGVGCTDNSLDIHTILERQSSALAQLPEEIAGQAVYDAEQYTDASEQFTPGSTLELETAREIALRDNPDIHAAQARVEQARALIMEARSAFFPAVGIGHSSTRTFHVPRTRSAFNIPSFGRIPSLPASVQDFSLNTFLQVLTLPLFNSQGLGGGGGNFSQHSSSITATWVLYEGFSRDAMVLAAKHSHQAGQMALADVQRLLIQAVDSAYYQAQLYRERIRIARENVRFSENLLANAQARRDAGDVTEADVQNAEVRLKTALADVVESNGLMENSRTVLAQLMGIDSAQLPPDLALAPLAEESPDHLAAPKADEWTEQALIQRPDLAQKKYEMLSKSEEVRAAKGRFSPIVSLSGNYGYDRLSNLNYDKDDQTSVGSIEFRWEITTGGARRARVRLREAERWQMAAEMRRLRQSIHSDVRQAVNNLIAAQEQVRLRRASLVSAAEDRRIVEEQYTAGKETIVRLNEAQRAFVETDASLALSRIQLRQAWTDLRTAAAAIRVQP